MKTINLKIILEIYLAQGENCLFEFLNRIEYKPLDNHSKFLMDNRQNEHAVIEYLTKLLKYGR